MVQTRRKTAEAAQDGGVKENNIVPPAPQTPTKKGKRGRPPKIRPETVAPSTPSTSSTLNVSDIKVDDNLKEEKLLNGQRNLVNISSSRHKSHSNSQDDEVMLNGTTSSSNEIKQEEEFVESPDPILQRKKSSEKPVLSLSPPSHFTNRISINKLKDEVEEEGNEREEADRDKHEVPVAANVSPLRMESSKCEDPTSPMHPDDPQPSSSSITRESIPDTTSSPTEPSTSTAFTKTSKSQRNSPSSASTSESISHQPTRLDESESMDIANSESDGEDDTADVAESINDGSSSSIPLPSSPPPPRKLSTKAEIHVDVDQKLAHTSGVNSPWDRSDEKNEKAASNPLLSPINRPRIHFLHPAYSSFASDSMTSPNPPPPEPSPKSVENGSSSSFKMTFKKAPTNPLLKSSALEQSASASSPQPSVSTAYTSNPSASVDALASPHKRSTNFGTTTANALPPPQMVELPKLSYFNMPPVTKSVFSENDSAPEEKKSPKPTAPTTTPAPKHTESELQAAKAKAEKIAQDITRRHAESRRLDENRYKEERYNYDNRRDDRDRDRRGRRSESDRRNDSDRRSDFDRRSDSDRRTDPDRRSDFDRRNDPDRRNEPDRRNDFDRRNDNEHTPRPRQRDEDAKRAFEREREVSRRNAREREEERERRQREEEKKKKEEEELEQRLVNEKQEREEEAKRAEEKKLKEEEMKIPDFELITECKYYTRNANKKRTESLLCECARTGGTCSDNTCVNRAMLTECPSSCISKCKNQRFAKRKTAAVEAYHTGTAKGCGLRALKDIKKGRFIIEYIGEVVERDDYEKRKIKYAADKKHKHHYLCDTGIYTIDATVYGNASRFVNHSCDPNAVCEKWSVPKTPGDISRIGFFAKRLIKAGEEITFDYQFVNYGRDAQKCLCGAATCTGWIGEKPEELSSSDDDDDDDIITTSHINMDEDQQEKLEELDDLEPYQKVELINEMLEDLNLRNKKHARKVITIATRMTDHTQRENLLRHLFSTDTNFGVQSFYAKEGMGTLMAAWLDADDYSLENLKLVQVILQTLHGDVFLACAKSESILLEVLTRWLNSSQGDWVDIHAVMNALVTCTENPEKDYPLAADEAEREILANFTRAKEMAFRLNHHWFNRSVSFRIPKKKPVPVEREVYPKEDVPSALAIEADQSRAVSPAYHRHHHYNNSYYNDRESHPRFFNNGNDIHQYRFTGYHGNNYKANYLTRRPIKDTYRDRRRISRRSRSRSRSGSPPNHKRRRLEDRENHRGRSPVDRRNISPNERSVKQEDRDSGKYERSESSLAAKNEEAVDAPVPHGYPSHDAHPYPVPPGYDPYGYNMQQAHSYPGYAPNPTYYPHPPTYVAPTVPVPVPLTLETMPNRDVLIAIYEKATIEQLCERLKAVEDETEILRMFVRERQAENARIEGERRRKDEEERSRRIRNMKYVWATAKDADNQTYYYNKITKETQWNLPTAEQGLLEPEGYVCPVMAIVAEEQRQEERKVEQAKRAELKPEEPIVKQEFEEYEVPREHYQRSSAEKSSVSPRSHRDRDGREGSRNRDRDSYNEGSVSERRIRDFKVELERSIRTEVKSHARLRDSYEANVDKTNWLIKLIAKEMFKRESSQHKFDFQFSENTDKKVRNYTKSLIDRKLESNDLWKGYNGSRQ